MPRIDKYSEEYFLLHQKDVGEFLSQFKDKEKFLSALMSYPRNSRVQAFLRANSQPQVPSGVFWRYLPEEYHQSYLSLTHAEIQTQITEHAAATGYRHHLQNPEVRNKIKETNLRKYGCEQVSSNSDIRKRIIQTTRDRYGSLAFRHTGDRESLFYYMKESQPGYTVLDTLSQVSSYEGSLHTYEWTFQHMDCGKTFTRVITNRNSYPVCPYCFKGKLRSTREEYFARYLEAHGLEVWRNTRAMISPYEIDLYIPSLRIGLEFNGYYWHRAVKVGRNYHQQKSQAALDRGVKLYQFWEGSTNEWIEAFLDKKLFHASTRVYARKLKIEKRSTSLYASHLLGFPAPGVQTYVLTDGNKDYYAMSWRIQGSTANNVRMCVAFNTEVIGGFQRLIKAFLRDNPSIQTLFTYCDRDLTPDPEDNVYFRNGFRYQACAPLMQYWVSRKTLVCGKILVGIEPRDTFMKKKLSSIWNDVDLSKTEAQICIEHGVYQVYNSGAWKYTIEV